MIAVATITVPKPMSPTTSYELYRKRSSDWLIMSAFDERDAAISAAENLLEMHPRAVVKVVAERFDAESGETMAVVVYRNDLKELPRPRAILSGADRPRRGPVPPAAKRARSAKAAKPANRRVVLVSVLVTVLSGTTFAALYGSIRYLSRFFG